MPRRPTVLPAEDKAEIVELICTTGKTSARSLANRWLARTAPAFL
jgi:transposase-like protein